MIRIIYLKGDMFSIILDIYVPEGGFFRSIDFSFYLFSPFDWPKMT